MAAMLWLGLLICAPPPCLAQALRDQARADAPRQDPLQPSAANGPFTDIVVTARKRPEVDLRVPIAISIYDQKRLDRLNVTTLQDLQSLTPSLYIQPSTFRQDTINIALRGQQNFQSTDLSFDTAVAVYVDGVYYARPVGLTGSLFDVDSVQVLNGPQGTLVGRNATGGAILYQTREPSDAFGGYIKGALGTYGHDDLQLALNLPLTPTLWFRAALDQTQTQGYIKNNFVDPVSGARNDTPGEGDRKIAGVFSLRWQPDATFHVTLRGSFDVEHDTGATYHDLGDFVGKTPAAGGKPSICNIPATCTGFTDLLGHVIAPYEANYLKGSTLNGSTAAYDALLNSVGREGQEGFWSAEQAVSNYDVGHFQVISGAAEKKLGEVDVKLTAAYRWFDASGDAVSRGLPYATNIFLYDTPDYRSYQSELTVNGASFSDRLNWTTGLFFFREASPDDGDQLYLFLPSAGTPAAATGRQITYTDPAQNSQLNTSYAAYGQATFALTPKTRLTGGLRYTQDVRDAELATQTVRFPASAATTKTVANGVYDPLGYSLYGVTYFGQTHACALTNPEGVLLPLTECRLDVEKTYHKPTWTLSVDHDLFARTLIYLTTRSGYRSGGVNAAAINPGAFLAKPEDINDYEVGVKSDFIFLGAPVRLNLDGYYSNYTNIQIQETIPNVTVASTLAGGVCTQAIFNAGQCLGASNDNVTLNARSAHIKGVEWELDVKPARGLTLSAAGSFIDAVYTNFSFSPPPGYLLPTGTTNLTGTHFPLPTWQLNETAAYRLPIARIAGTSLDYMELTWHLYTQSHNEAPLTGYNPAQRMKGYSLSSLGLDFVNIAGVGLDFGAFVTNLFNKEACIPEPQGVLNSAPNATFGTAGTSGVLQCVPLPPRMASVRFAYRF